MARIRSQLKWKHLLDGIIYILGLGMAFGLVWYAAFATVARTRFASAFLGLGMALFFFARIKTKWVESEEATETKKTPSAELLAYIPGFRSFKYFLDSKTRSKTWSWVFLAVNLGCAAVSLSIAAYIEYHFNRLFEVAPIVGYTQQDVLVGWAAILISLYVTKIAYGSVLAGALALSAPFAYFGPSLPGTLAHTGVEFNYIPIAGAMALDGVYGFVLDIGATWVAIFILFAGVAKGYGLMEFVTDISRQFEQSFQTGVAQVALISSMVMGSITGSAAANTATTGSFTIPMMKEQGIRSDYAASVEAVASSGGQMLPPVMGTAAFLMADIIDIPYAQILQYALIPALLFYFCASFATHLIIHKHGWTSEKTGGFAYSELKYGIHYLVPLAVLLYTLIILRLSPLLSGLYALVSMIAVTVLKDAIVDGISIKTSKRFVAKSATGLKEGSEDMAPLVGVLAAIGFAIGMIQQTGVAGRISTQLVSLAGGSLLLLLVLTMITSILFGMGMPTVAAYLLMVVLVTPALTEVGIPIIATHLFVFYFGMLSAITPPVAISVVIGGRIADSSFLPTALQSLRIGIGGFLVPFVFVLNQELLFWSFPTTLITLGFVAISFIGLTIASVGYNGMRNIGFIERMVYVVLALGGFFAPGDLRLIPVGILLILVFRNRYTSLYQRAANRGVF